MKFSEFAAEFAAKYNDNSDKYLYYLWNSDDGDDGNKWLDVFVYNSAGDAGNDEYECTNKRSVARVKVIDDRSEKYWITDTKWTYHDICQTSLGDLIIDARDRNVIITTDGHRVFANGQQIGHRMV